VARNPRESHSQKEKTMKTLNAVRKHSPVITVVRVSEDNLKELIELKYLNQHGNAIDSSRNKNPSKVNIGDYIRIDNPDDMYPINPEYFDNTFNVVEE
jgi:hypothetical protein